MPGQNGGFIRVTDAIRCGYPKDAAGPLEAFAVDRVLLKKKRTQGSSWLPHEMLKDLFFYAVGLTQNGSVSTLLQDVFVPFYANELRARCVFS